MTMQTFTNKFLILVLSAKKGQADAKRGHFVTWAFDNVIIECSLSQEFFILRCDRNSWRLRALKSARPLNFFACLTFLHKDR